MHLTILVLVGLFSEQVLSDSKKNRTCQQLEKCLDSLSKISGQDFFSTSSLDKRLKNTISLKDNSQWANKMTAQLLAQFKLARVFLGPKEYKIIPANEIRYESLPLIKNIQNVAKTMDYTSMLIEAKNRDVKILTRNMRPLLSRYGRVIDINKNNIFIIDTGENIHRLYKLIHLTNPALP
jgi:hypothetical protein